MSSTLDVLQKVLLEWNVLPEARWLVGAIHDYSHEHNDDLNRDPKIRIAAAKLEKAMEKHKLEFEESMKKIKPIEHYKGMPRGDSHHLTRRAK